MIAKVSTSPEEWIGTYSEWMVGPLQRVRERCQRGTRPEVPEDVKLIHPDIHVSGDPDATGSRDLPRHECEYAAAVVAPELKPVKTGN